MKFFLCIALSFAFSILSSAGFAQSRSLNAAAEAQFEAQANAVLSKNLSSESFQVTADIVLDETKLPKLPLSPGASREAVLKSMNLATLASLAKSIQVEVSVDSTINVQAQKAMERILQKKLFLDAKRGDSVKFQRLQLPTSASRMRDDLSKSTNELSTLKSRNDALERELRAIEKNLADAKAERQQALDKLSSAGKKVESSLERWAPVMLPAALIISGFLMLCGLIISTRKASQTLSSSLRSVAQSLAKGQSQPEIVREPVASLPVAQNVRLESGTRSIETNRESSRDTKARLFELHSEIVSTYDETTRNFILEHVTKMLRKTETLSTAILLMEFLGQERANELFHLLDGESQSKVLAYMQNREPEADKLSLMVAAGEELKTLLVVNGMKNLHENRNSVLGLEILQLTDNQVVSVLESLGENAASRFMSYLSPKDLARVLKLVEPQSLDRILSALVRVPELSGLDTEDRLIQETIGRVRAQHDENIVRYYGYFKTLVETSDDTISDLIKARLVEPELKGYIVENTVSYSLLFEVDDDTISGVVGTLSLRELALLLHQADATQAERVRSLLTAKKQELVAEETSFVTDLSKNQLETQFKALREKVIADLKARQVNGTLVRKPFRPNLKIA